MPPTIPSLLSCQALKVGLLAPDQPPEHEGETLGYLASDPEQPALVTNTFGRGRTAFFAFDLAKSLGTREAADLLTAALLRVAPRSDDPALALVSGGEVAIQISLQARVVDIAGLVLEDVLPSDAEVLSASYDGVVSGNQITWYLDLSVSEPTIITYLVRLPSATSYTATTRSFYLVRGIYYTHPPFADLTLTFQIAEPGNVREEILSGLDALEVSGGEAALVNQTANLIATLPDLSLELTPGELEKALGDILKAIKALDKVTSLDYQTCLLPIRYKMGLLMFSYEGVME